MGVKAEKKCVFTNKWQIGWVVNNSTKVLPDEEEAYKGENGPTDKDIYILRTGSR